LSVRVRLTRVGGRKNPIWRVVVADQRSPRDGRIIETVGRYNAQTDPSEIVLDADRLTHWLDRGAQPTSTVKKLMRTQGIGGIGGGATGGNAAVAVDDEPAATAVEEPAADSEVAAGLEADATAEPEADAAPEPGASTASEPPAPDEAADAPAAPDDGPDAEAPSTS
jgi:small subunit ribosomal protein S16